MRTTLFGAFAAAVLALGAQLAAPPVAAQDDGLSDAARRRIEHERTRQAVEDGLNALTTDKRGPERNQAIVAGATRLVEMGDAAVPFLIAELDAQSRTTFTFVAYVLGRTGHPDAIPALQRHVELAEIEPGQFGEARKAWALYALGMLGEESALRLLGGETHSTESHSIHFDTTVTELIATFTAPRSVPLLHELLAGAADEDEDRIRRMPLIQAMRRAPHPTNVPVLAGLLDDENRAARRYAVRALAAHEGARVNELLLAAAFGDDDPPVRWEAAHILLRSGRPVPVEPIVARLADEPDANVRALLYQLVARRGGKARLGDLVSQWGLPDPADRGGLLAALAKTRTVRAVKPIAAGLDAPELSVYHTAVRALGTIGSKYSLELLRARIDDPDWERARLAMEELTRLKDAASVAPMVRRLLEVELRGVVTAPGNRFRVIRILDLLLELGPPADLAERLAEPIARQSDASLLLQLDEVRAALDALTATPADDVAGWAARLDAEQEAVRRAAVRRLVAIGTDAAAQKLAAAFEDLPAKEQGDLLVRLGELDTPASRALVLRVISAEKFDDILLEDVRSAAARAARLLGGEDMVAGLRASALRRDGRDVSVLFALALIAGNDAIATLEAVRLPRLTYLRWSRGVEQDWVEWTLRQLRAGRTLEPVDVDVRDMRFASPF